MNTVVIFLCLIVALKCAFDSFQYSEARSAGFVVNLALAASAIALLWYNLIR